MKEHFDAVEEIAGRLEGTAAKLAVMAAAFQPGAGIPNNETIEAALVSVAEEVTAAKNSLLALLDAQEAAE